MSQHDLEVLVRFTLDRPHHLVPGVQYDLLCDDDNNMWILPAGQDQDTQLTQNLHAPKILLPGTHDMMEPGS